MCGWVISDSAKTTEMALDFMQHRGTQSGLEKCGSWYLGHRRLPIMDLTDEANQPYQLERGFLLFAGEIFDYPSDYGSDTAFLASLIDSGGVLTELHRSDGMWAIATVSPTGRFAVCTDYLGQKPVYYSPDHSIIASEPGAIKAAIPQLQPDKVFFSNAIKWGYDPTGRTPWEGVYQMPPGCILWNSWHATPYWDWSSVYIPHRSLRNNLALAVHNRCRGKLPMALLFSGGLDSSIINLFLPEDIDRFFLDTGDEAIVPARAKIITPKYKPSLQKALRSMQAPCDAGSLLPQVDLADAIAKEGYNVVLSGDGADELFGGYQRAVLYDSQSSDIFTELPYWHLPRLDRVMMRNTIELRAPFLAPYIVKQALALPQSERTEKKVLRKAFPELPDRVRWGKKIPLKSVEVKEAPELYRSRLIELWKTMY